MPEQAGIGVFVPSLERHNFHPIRRLSTGPRYPATPRPLGYRDSYSCELFLHVIQSRFDIGWAEIDIFGQQNRGKTLRNPALAQRINVFEELLGIKLIRVMRKHLKPFVHLLISCEAFNGLRELIFRAGAEEIDLKCEFVQENTVFFGTCQHVLERQFFPLFGLNKVEHDLIHDSILSERTPDALILRIRILLADRFSFRIEVNEISLFGTEWKPPLWLEIQRLVANGHAQLNDLSCLPS